MASPGQIPDSIRNNPSVAGSSDRETANHAIEATSRSPEVPSSHSPTKIDVVYPTGIRLFFLTIGLMAVVLVVALDNYILDTATAIPTISTQFHGLDLVGWYASSYFLAQMAFQPAFGHLFTDFPVKNVFVAAILLFEVGSIVCASATGSFALILGRFIAGAGGGGLYVGTLTFIGLAVPIRKRAFYISLVTSMFGVASVAGPLLGGVFTDSNASIPLWLARQPTVAASSSFLLFISLIVGLLIYYLPLYFQLVKGSSARASGIQNLPFLVTMLFSPIASGALVSTFGFYVPFMWLGAILATVGSGLLFSLRVDSASSRHSGYQFITGLGLGICTQIPFNAVQYMLPHDQMAMGSAIVSFCNSLGPILGTNIGQAIFSNVFLKRLEHLPNINAKAIILAAPTNQASIGTPALITEASNYAITRTFLLAVVSGILAFASSLAMEWGNVKLERKETGGSVPREIAPALHSADIPMSATHVP
ncbi:MAG: hypothetical protein Q9226_003660 [Calogaya cf. arnoldii]